MPTWENELFINALWLDTSNRNLNVLKKFDPITNTWIPTTATTAEEIGTYSSETIENKFAALQLSGPTSARPAGARMPTTYFDTDLGKPIWLLSESPQTWVDSTGAIV
ncbi:hypothetical protein [Bacillus sp. UNC438CL73TsuS30]|uniref:hypothetical protein n=1 Tax=Bacillus sp. UNC438CL73TsuS30 TaxID=1340434 RepID=UPI00055126E1|nr:hypothetical protein [Bacillus sp. UNC438CL73TsuS30]